MSVTYLPGGGQVQQQQGPNQGLVQLAMAVQQMKQGQVEQKRQEAVQFLDFLTKDPQNALMFKPESVEKAFTTAFPGAQMSTSKDVQGMLDQYTKMAGAGGTAPAAGAAPSAPPAQPPAAPTQVQGNQLEQLGKVMGGNPAGAQAGAPPSDQAGRKAPGGGVSAPGGVVTPGTGAINQLVDTANQAYAQQFSGVGGLMMRGISAQQQAYMQAQKTAELETLGAQARRGDVRATARLYSAAGVKLDDQAIRGVLLGSNDPKDFQAAKEFALGYESPAQKATRESDIMKTLSGNQEFMGKLKDPLQLPSIVHSIAEGNGVPEGTVESQFTPSQLTRIAANQKQYVEQGYDSQTARNVAEGEELGVPATQALPPLLHGTLQQQETGAKTLTAQADMVKALADKQQSETTAAELEFKMKTNPELAQGLNVLEQMQKAGMPRDMIDEQMSKVGRMSGVDIQRVRSWWDWMYIGTHLEGTRIPPSVLQNDQGQPDLGNGKVGSSANLPMSVPAGDIRSLAEATTKMVQKSQTHGGK